MKILALDTATEACSAALLHNGQVLTRYEVAGRSHTERLMPMVHALLAEAGCGFGQLDGIACGVGPGSFAGVRIGVGYVKGLALARDLPVVGVSSLAMLAQAQLAQGAPRVLAAIDARMHEVYFGAYDNTGVIGEEYVGPAHEVCAAAPGPWAAAGSGWKTYGAALTLAVGLVPAPMDPEALPRAEHALHLALPEFAAGRAQSADGLTPTYLRNKVALTLLEQADLRRKNQR